MVFGVGRTVRDLQAKIPQGACVHSWFLCQDHNHFNIAWSLPRAINITPTSKRRTELSRNALAHNPAKKTILFYLLLLVESSIMPLMTPNLKLIRLNKLRQFLLSILFLVDRQPELRKEHTVSIRLRSKVISTTILIPTNKGQRTPTASRLPLL